MALSPTTGERVSVHASNAESPTNRNQSRAHSKGGSKDLRHPSRPCAERRGARDARWDPAFNSQPKVTPVEQRKIIREDNCA